MVKRFIAAALLTLSIASPATAEGEYSRDAFMKSWASQGWNAEFGCRMDTRDLVLINAAKFAEGRIEISVNKSGGCTVVSLDYFDSYTGKMLDNVAGRSVDVDHVVSLADAWRSGADKWTAERRKEFANDLRNLRAANAHDNRSKGDSDLTEWMPLQGRCEYAKQYESVKAIYGLTITAAQHAATLTACNGSL